ncbi:TlpA family protein disulfide reductase [Zhouia amylolytica]|uniref:Redoxin domain-containing protein n=1 Tax=Zhouia amylolytica AD3 TaxID=1286632 RepID=W2UPE6_9FLAO|nr:TlpA disulfide reductase family protein [Zhouia amylolytica]ETN95863.1 redoxin domain-containing protein [Zhouia amylolytica AD3]
MLKKIILISGLFTLLNSCETEIPKSKTVISGTITNPNNALLLIAGNDYFRDTIQVDESGNFKDTLDILPGSYLLSYGKLFWRTYLQNGYDLEIVFDSNNFRNTLSYKGEGGVENNYLFQKISKQREAMTKRQEAMKMRNDSSLLLLNDLKEAMHQFLSSYPALPPAFKGLEKRSITYGYIADLHRLHSKDTLGVISGLTSKLNALEENMDFNSGMDYLFSNRYRRMIEDTYREKAQISAKTSNLAEDIAFLKEISNIKNDTIRNSLAFNHAKYGITYTKDLNTFYSLFLKSSTNPIHNEDIKASYEILKKVAKGAPSPGFEDYENHQGGTTSLKDLAGSYLFIDVWATWCGPCRKEIPYLKELETKYHDKNIKFVSISIDRQKDRDKWKQMIKDENLGGVQLLADKDWESSFVQNYLIKGIPRFIILDPQGNIIDYNAPVPSSGKLESIFDEFNL